MDKLTSVRLDSDLYDDFYIGRIIKQTPKWTVFEGIDEDYNIGSISFFANPKISFPQNNNDLSFYELLLQKNQIKDPFNQIKKNQEVLSWEWDSLDKLLKIIKEKMLIVDIETEIGFFSGVIIDVKNKNLVLRLLDFDFSYSDLIENIALSKIVSISINFTMSEYINKWQNISQWFNRKSNLVEIYFDYDVEERRDNFLLGKIITESTNALLVEVITEQGMLNSYTLLNKKWIRQIKENEVGFYDYLIDQNKKLNIFNQNHLTIANCKFKDLAIEAAIKEIELGQIIIVNDIFYNNQNIGVLKKKNDYSFILQNFDNYKLTYNDTFRYEDIASIDLVSKDQTYYQFLI